MRSRRMQRIAFVGLGAVGLFVGHALNYALVVPDAAHRHVVLAASGHGYLGPLAWIVAAVGCAAAGAGIATGYRGRPTRGMGGLALRLSILQACAFIVLEVGERLAAGAPIGDLDGPLVWVGLLAQVVVAIVGAIVLAGLRRVGHALRAPRRPATVRDAATCAMSSVAAPARDPWLNVRAVRAPPPAPRLVAS